MAMTLFYIGGMYLNDAFDRKIDSRERPSRPIPAGEISALTVLSAGFAMLVVGIGLMSLFGFASGSRGSGLRPSSSFMTSTTKAIRSARS